MRLINVDLHALISKEQDEKLRRISFEHKVSVGKIIRTLIDKFADKIYPAKN